MRFFALALGAACLFTTQAMAVDARFERVLKMLDPGARLEQLCDYTAMTNIKKDTREYRPDRAIAGARAEPMVRGDTIKAEGAAFRSHKKWYALTYTCAADAEHMKVLAFKYKIGAEIPESNWAAYNLFD
ncbi:DUF930 domain-containing protein [Microbacteriaceae bacterium K1510]|nr:DUF930 domain-containing protein [Microbacteriaceae bacterium K1510]